MKISWKAVAPIALAIIIALLPVPPGLPQHAGYFFAIFAVTYFVALPATGTPWLFAIR